MRPSAFSDQFKPLTTVKHPILSVVITSYNAERKADFAELLKCLKEQTCTQIEVLYVIERSIELYIWLQDFIQENQLTNVKVVFSQKKLGLAGARNVGVVESIGDILAFIDDDVLLPSNWAEEMTKTYELGDHIIGVTGPAYPLWEDKSMRWLPKEFYWLISCTAWSNLNKLEEVRSAWGMNMSFRREAFLLAGLFDAELSGYHKPIAEDLHFSLLVRYRTGKIILFNPEVKVKHRVYNYRLTWAFVAKRSHHIGMSRYIIKKIPYTNVVASNREINLVKRLANNFVIETFKTLYSDPHTFKKRVSLFFLSSTYIVIGYFDGYRFSRNAKAII